MRGYFGIGVEGINKAYNIGNVFRTAHAFEASFVFTVNAQYDRREGGKVDTSKSVSHVPFYKFPTVGNMILPQGCVLVGIELTEDAIDLPSFRHPNAAAYVLGSEREGLSPEMQAACRHIIKIPMRFSINLGMAGALVMYDRLLSTGRFADRPVRSGGGPKEIATPHVHGGPKLRKKARLAAQQNQTLSPMPDTMDAFLTEPPLAEIAKADHRNDSESG